MPLSPEQMRDAVDRYFASWASLDPSAYVACFTEDAVVHTPYGTQPYHGTSALRRFFGEVALALQEVTIIVDAIHVAGNRTAVVFQGTAIGKNGKPAKMDGIDVFEFDDAGRITTLWAYWDSTALLAKLRQ
ncbi:MAG: nuclear transport factor 2 family protein [Gemmatimonadota bacterium]|nr:nuclear transport factor 2 family protein [Gemmatimonadota bacterium]